MLSGINVSSGGVRGVWSRHNLLQKHQRFLRLEQSIKGKKIDLTEEQIRPLERFSPEFRERHIETRHTGDLVAVDTYLIHYNTKRPHQGRKMNRRTPEKVFKEGLQKPDKIQHQKQKKTAKIAA